MERETTVQELAVCTLWDAAQLDRIEALKEWVRWNERQGVRRIYVYTSVPPKEVAERLQSLVTACVIELLPWQGSLVEAFQDGVRRHRQDVIWLVLQDASSFLAPVPADTTLATLLQAVKDQMPHVAGVHLGGANVFIMRPDRIRVLPASGQFAVAEGYQAAEDAGRYFTLLSYAAVRARLYPDRPKRIALASHVLYPNGAPLALLSAAKYLQKQGYELHVYACLPGPMQERFEALGIPVRVQKDLLEHAWTDLPWYGDYDLILANTVLFLSCFQKPLGETPVLWWLHEGMDSYRWLGYDKAEQAIRRGVVRSARVTTVGVSAVACQAFHALVPDWPIAGTLPLGVEDFCGRRDRVRDEAAPRTFLTIGGWEPRKGQDLLVDAVSRLTPDERRMCRFQVIGDQEGAVASVEWLEDVKRKMAQYPEIEPLGRLPHADVLQRYRKADALIVSSREEMLPTVAIEGMAAGIPCILSDGCGVADFVEDGKSALVFPTGDAAALAEALREVIHHPETAAAIGRAGRAVYEASFQPQQFEARLLHLVEARMTGRAEES